MSGKGLVGHLPALRALINAGAIGAAQYLATQRWFCRSKSRQSRVLDVCRAGLGGELNPVAPDFDEELERLEHMVPGEHFLTSAKSVGALKAGCNGHKGPKKSKNSNIYDNLAVYGGYSGDSEDDGGCDTDEEDDDDDDMTEGELKGYKPGLPDLPPRHQNREKWAVRAQHDRLGVTARADSKGAKAKEPDEDMKTAPSRPRKPKRTRINPDAKAKRNAAGPERRRLNMGGGSGNPTTATPSCCATREYVL